MTMFAERPCTTCEGEDHDCETCYGTGMETVRVGGSCDVCGHSATWGCGHEPHHEAEAREHDASPEHQSGACWHFDHSDCDPAECKLARTNVPGYAPFVKHQDAEAFFAKQ